MKKYIRFKIKSEKEGIVYYYMAYEEYERRINAKPPILIGISYKEYEWIGREIIELEYYCDNKRHLVCKTYSIENLHFMDEDINIKRWWFHKNHYDIPKRRIEEITAKCILVTTLEIVEIKNASIV